MKVITNKSDRFLRAPEALMSMNLTEKLIKRRGLEFIDLDPIVPRTPRCEGFREKLKEFDLSDNTPASQQEVCNLREVLAGIYQKIYNHKVHPDKDIVITPGSRATAILICLSMVNPGQVVAIPDPGLSTYRLAAVMAGAEPFAYPLLEKNDFLPNLSALFEPPPQNLSLVFLNYPHCPTGAEADSYFYRDLINILKYENILIVADTAFTGVSEPAIDLPLQTAKASNMILELHSFGFPYGLAGLGFATGHRGAVENLKQVTKASGITPNKAEINYILTAIEYHDDIFAEYMNRLNDRRRVLSEGLKEIGWHVRNSRLTPFIWAKAPAKSTSAGFARKLFLKTGVRTRPGTDFGENGEGYLRFSLTVSAEKIEKALKNIQGKSSLYGKRGS